jgi:hypothetical protein
MAAEKKHIHLLFIVTGTIVKMNVSIEETLRDGFTQALKKAGIAGDQDPDAWEFTYNKAVLDQNKAIGQFGFPEDAQIFLNKKAGAAG